MMEQERLTQVCRREETQKSPQKLDTPKPDRYNATLLLFSVPCCIITGMTTQSPLAFKVLCSACYGTAVWQLNRIGRTLTAAGELPPGSETDIEFVAEQFIAHCKQMSCVGCGKTGLITVFRVPQ
jgi:hypothetical protein